MRILCFDIGGTSIKYSLIEDENNFSVQSIPTRVTDDNNFILADIIDTISKYDNIDAIGISSAGVVDNKNGVIVFSGPTIPNYTNTKIKETIEKKFNIKCFVENDVNSAAFGEYNYTKSSGVMFFLTIGTGVGGSIIINGNIYTGNSLTAGEIGYLPLNGGYYQEFCSAKFLTDYVSDKLNKKVDGIYVFENAKTGDKLCNDAIDIMIDNLTVGLLNISYILNPKSIVIGGGITAQGKYLEDKILNSVNSRIISNNFMPEIRLAKLKNKAGLLGIYYIAKKGLLNEF